MKIDWLNIENIGEEETFDGISEIIISQHNS
jgi:hypothetical protein